MSGTDMRVGFRVGVSISVRWALHALAAGLATSSKLLEQSPQPTLPPFELLHQQVSSDILQRVGFAVSHQTPSELEGRVQHGVRIGHRHQSALR